MERQILNFNIEWLEALWSVLALISAALSVYLWKRAAAVPSLPDQPAFTSAWRARLHAQAGSAAAFNSSTNHCMATTIKDNYPGLYSITSSIEKDPLRCRNSNAMGGEAGPSGLF